MAESVSKPLTLKQRRFVEEYAADPNGVQAYFRAFGRYTSKGVRRNYYSAGEQARRLLKKPEIAAELARAQEEWRSRVGVDKERVLTELAAIGFADPDDVYQPDPDSGGLPVPRPWRDIPVPTRKAIQSVKVKRKRLASDSDGTAWEVEELEYRFHPKLEALDKLCRRLGLFGDEAADGPFGQWVRELVRGRIEGGSGSGGGGALQSRGLGSGGPAADVANAAAPETD